MTINSEIRQKKALKELETYPIKDPMGVRTAETM
jgi:hypothetical protein